MIAIGLMSVIVLAAGSFEIASRRFLNSSERKTTVINEITYALEHIEKHAAKLHRCFIAPDQYVFGTALFGTTLPGGYDYMANFFRVQNTSSPTRDDCTSADEIYYYYEWDNGTHNLTFANYSGFSASDMYGRRGSSYMVGARELVSSRITNLTWLALDNYTDNVTITARYDPSQPMDNSTNPEASVFSRIRHPEISLP